MKPRCAQILAMPKRLTILAIYFTTVAAMLKP